jgi:Protein of unknown function (DUF1153)
MARRPRRLDRESRALWRQALLMPVARWTPGKRRALVAGIAAGLVTEDEARTVHAISRDELTEWRRALRLRAARAAA